MGAPVMAFCRIDDKPIRMREPVMEPDALIIQDSTLLHQVDVFAGFKRDGYILINTSKSFAELGLAEFIKDYRQERLCAVPATDLSIKHLGRPMPNVPLLGGFAAISGRIKLESVAAAINDRFSGKVAEANIAAATEAYNLVKESISVRGEPDETTSHSTKPASGQVAGYVEP
jgi:pyruvate ferredoxin oxidoreductase gamma subunit